MADKQILNQGCNCANFAANYGRLQVKFPSARNIAALCDLIDAGADFIELIMGEEDQYYTKREHVPEETLQRLVESSKNFANLRVLRIFRLLPLIDPDSGFTLPPDILRMSRPTLLELEIHTVYIDRPRARILSMLLPAFPELSRLSLQNNVMCDEEAVILSEGIARGGIALTELSFRNNGLRSAGVEAVAKAVQTKPTMRRLDLSMNFFGSIPAAFLARLGTISKLVLDGSGLGGMGLKILLSAELGKSVRSLSLQTCDIKTSGADAIAEVLGQSTCAISHLNLNRNEGMEFAKFSKALASNTSLLRLELEQCHLYTRQITELAQGLRRNLRIEFLTLRSNSIGSDGIRELCQALSTNSQLRSLTLSDNCIQEDSAWLLGEMLRRNRSLRNLYLSSCNLFPGDVKSIANGILRNQESEIERLDLSCNEVGDGGARAVAELILRHGRLRELDLRTNTITEAGGTAIADAVGKGGDRLERLLIAFNALGDGGARKFATVLMESARTHFHLDLTGIIMEEETAGMLRKISAAHPYVTILIR